MSLHFSQVTEIYTGGRGNIWNLQLELIETGTFIFELDLRMYILNISLF